MSEDIYFKLGENLNQYQVKMLLIEPFLDILREIYTEEQAVLGAELPMGAYTAPELAKKLNREEAPLTALLETMADKGTIFVSKSEDKVSSYALTPFVPGVVEFQLMRGTDTPQDRKIARMLDSFMEGEMGDIMRETLKDPEIAKQLIPDPPARIITVQKELPRESNVQSYEKVTELVEKETFFAAAKCYCRHHAYLLDKPCKIDGVPELSCLTFGKAAEYVADRGFGKEISKQEALDILEATNKAGLVHNTNNFIDNTTFICNCCGCCCGFLRMLKEYQNSAMLAFSNFMVQVDGDTCSGCGDCLERCPMEALSLDGEVAALNESMCIGCGNCVSVCPTESLSMVRRADAKPPEAGDSLTSLGM